MKKNTVIMTAAGILAAGAVSSYYSPYWTLHAMRSAIVDNDADDFSSHVDFPALRENLRGQMLVLMQRKMGTDPEMKGNGFAALGMMMAAGIMNQMIDTMVTPSGVMAMVAKGKAEPSALGGASATHADQPSESSRTEPSNYTVRYKNWSTVVTTANEDSQTPVGFVFKRDGLWSWKLAAINLPLDGSEQTADKDAPSAAPQEQQQQ